MMALPIDPVLEDKSNLPDIIKKIIFCCSKMQNTLLNPDIPGLMFEPVGVTKENHPTINLANISFNYEPIDFCPFCGTHIEIRPS